MALSRTARYYKYGSTVKGKRNTKRAKEARKKHVKYQKEYNSSREQKDRRNELARLNRKLGSKKGDKKDVSHQSDGSVKLEHQSKNRGNKYRTKGDRRARGKKMQKGGIIPSIDVNELREAFLSTKNNSLSEEDLRFLEHVLKDVPNIYNTVGRSLNKSSVPLLRNGRFLDIFNRTVDYAQEGGQVSSYKVKKGDTLWDISKNYGVGLEELAEWNNLENPDYIVPGQELQLKREEVINSPISEEQPRIVTNVEEDTTDTTVPIEEVELQEISVKGYTDTRELFPIYEDLKDFYYKNKNRTAVVKRLNKEKTKEFGRNIYEIKEEPYIKGDLSHCVGDDAQCMERANIGINALVTGNNFFLNSDEIKKKIGVSYTKADKPTVQEKNKYPYALGDKNSLTLDSWDIAYQFGQNSPDNVIFDFMEGKQTVKESDKLLDKRLSVNELQSKFKGEVPVGSYIQIGLNRLDSDEDMIQGGSHTVRVVGFDKKGEILVSDLGQIKVLEEALHINGDRDEKQITAVLSVPTKEKYTFNYFQERSKLMDKPSNEEYISNFNELPVIDSEGNVEKVKATDEFKKFTETLNTNKNYILGSLDIDGKTYDEYARLAISLAGAETKYGNSKFYNLFKSLKKSKGVSQLRLDNVKDKYKHTLSKYKENTTEYTALATILYINEINRLKSHWSDLGQDSQERPYIKDDFSVKDYLREYGQGRTKQGYSGEFGEDVFTSNGQSIDIPTRGIFESKEDYTDRINNYFSSIEGNLKDKLRFAYDDKDRRVIFKQTEGNSVNTRRLKDAVFYGWQSPSSIVYGDAQGNSTYYKKVSNIYNTLFQ